MLQKKSLELYLSGTHSQRGIPARRASLLKQLRFDSEDEILGPVSISNFLTARPLAQTVRDDSMTIAETTKLSVENYYRDYGARKGSLRNDLLRNPEVLFQVFAADASIVSALRSIQVDPAQAKVLDVGCGDGASLFPLLRLGFEPSNLYGVDIRGEQIARAQARYPGLHFQNVDASFLKFPGATFDIVQESMMFLQMTDQELGKQVAQEMIRVAKPSGCLLLSDWRYGKPGTSEFKPLNGKRIAELFQVGSATRIHGVFSGALVPPIGRFLSKNLPALYFLIQRLLPLAVAQVTTVLTKV